ncbi:outer membrane protein/peptidoglycan-associated (lipo)protein [Thiovulum sp. ES]|nr:outer membrane protein/peptidoglycan-associated (lipo)protein [Thiovulum sp. ES]
MQNSENENGEEWLSISDLMSGLMLIFLLIAITFMYQVNKRLETTIDYKKKLEEISKEYALVEENLYQALRDEFRKEELEKWNVIILPNNTIRFNSPDVLFESGEDYVSDEFKGILVDFFPRYVGVLTRDDFVNFVEEVRVEGHTSSIWNGYTGINAYLKNLDLSQRRAKNVLDFAIRIDKVYPKFEWLKLKFRANGLSSAIPIRDENGNEDTEMSKRVEFRITTNARDALQKLETLRKEMESKEK